MRLEARPCPPHPEVAPSVVLYSSTWYEIASFTYRFQKGCSSTSATYILQPHGTIQVVNRCTRADKADSIKGTAKVTEQVTNEKIAVTLFWPFSGITGSSSWERCMGTLLSATRLKIPLDAEQDTSYGGQGLRGHH